MSREPWGLLADLDALLSREGWQSTPLDVTEMECRISDETGIKAPRKMATLWSASNRDAHAEPPFLRSRDAAAMLEAEIHNAISDGLELDVHADGIEVTWNGPPFSKTIPWRAKVYRHTADEEPAARTRAALEAGFRIGLWPVGREG